MRPQYVEGVYSNSMTLKCRLGVTEGRWKRHYSIDRTRLLLLVELYDVEKYFDLEIWVKLVPLESLGGVSCSPSVVTLARYGDLLVENYFCYTPPVFSAPRRW